MIESPHDGDEQRDNQELERSTGPQPAGGETHESAEGLIAEPDATARRTGPVDDLVLALVGAVGTNLPWVEGTLETHLLSLGFKVHRISLSGLIGREFGDELSAREDVPYDEYVMQRMTAGNVLRRHWERADAVALLAIEEIRRERDEYGENPPACAFILRSVKRDEEVLQFRNAYRGQFLLVGCHAPRTQRINQLADDIARSRSTGRPDPQRAYAERLADRDENEHGEVTDPPAIREDYKLFGQCVEDTFSVADGYVNLQELGVAESALRRFCDLVLGSPFISPSRDEVAMFHAQAAAVRSSDMSRQVGAAIATPEGDIIAIGCNEVPRAGGGAYWEGDRDDARDFKRGFDGNEDQRKRALQEVFEVLKARELLTNKAVAAGAKAFLECLDDTRVDGLIEFTRATHAEMAALLDAARRGSSVRGCVLYTSTFPCHNCAKHIVSAGISRVVFIEPYPKSLAGELHGDAIEIDERCDSRPTVHFEHFSGVAPDNYFALFRATGKRKAPDGGPQRFSIAEINPKLRGNFREDIYPFEQAVIEDLDALRENLGSPTSEMLKTWASESSQSASA